MYSCKVQKSNHKSADEFISKTSYVYDLYALILLQFFTQFGYEDIHASGREEIVSSPEFVKDQWAIQNRVLVLDQMKQQMGFSMC